MKMNRSTNLSEYKLVNSFEEVRRRLLDDASLADRLDKPLGFWALPSDRSSPIALLGRPIRELLGSTFDELCATPGIGQKKISSLVDLLERAASPNPPGALTDEEVVDERFEVVAGDGSVDTTLVSEALWVQWRETVKRHGLGNESLGRLAASLQALPRVIWETPLDVYTGLPLGQIRSLKTHGEKRVRAVLEIFGAIHQLLGRADPNPHLAARVKPRFATQIEQWILRVLRQEKAVGPDEVRRSFIEPVMQQLRLDAGDQIEHLVGSRLGIDGDESSVRQVARRLGLTRARVYQLLGDASAVMAVRWPEGWPLVRQLQRHLRECTTLPGEWDQFDAAVELLFPSKSHQVPAPVANFKVASNGAATNGNGAALVHSLHAD